MDQILNYLATKEIPVALFDIANALQLSEEETVRSLQILAEVGIVKYNDVTHEAKIDPEVLKLMREK